MSEQDGGPAFPNPYPGHLNVDGMTLRDWFAGQTVIRVIEEEYKDPKSIATGAYEIADAMLKEREK